MTATTAKPTLPDFEGSPVHYSALKFSGTGTGFSDGLKIEPLVLHNGDEAYFVFRGTVSGIDHPLDKDELTFRRHDLKIVDMAPIDRETAERVLSEYAETIQRKRDEIEGQLRLDDEQAALEREKLDETGTPAEIAKAAGTRAKS